MKNIKKYQLINIFSFFAVIIMNFLANYLPLNGYNTGEISDMYPNLFVPAAITFSIWGLIYLFLFAFIIYQSKGLFNNLNKAPKEINKIGWLFFISSIANIFWLISWHYLKPFISLLFMILLLITLITIYLKLNIGKNNYSKIKKWLISVPFSLYLGWITVATIANVSAYLVAINWSRWGISEVIWTIILIIIGLILTILNTIKRQDSIYALVIVWSYIGIILKRYQSSPRYMNIIITAAISIIIILFNLFYQKKKNKSL
ncbi:MAG: hypothetical protein ACQEQF_07945 [Bacillota bacterium]